MGIAALKMFLVTVPFSKSIRFILFHSFLFISYFYFIFLFNIFISYFHFQFMTFFQVYNTLSVLFSRLISA